MGIFGTMFSDISASLFRRPATEKYPLKRREAPLKLRGLASSESGGLHGLRFVCYGLPS